MTRPPMMKIVASIAIIAASGFLYAAEGETKTSAAKNVPDEVIEQIEAQFGRPPGQTREEMLNNFATQLEAAIALGQKAEKEYPKAENLHVVRAHMLEAASFLAAQKSDAASRNLQLDIAARIVAGESPVESKIAADYVLTLNKVQPEEDKPLPAAEATKEIRAFVARYAGTDAALEATMRGTVIARRTKNKELEDELAKVLETNYADKEGVRRLLRQLGRSPDIGKPFKAELTSLDGKKLTLPDDLKGKVVVIDFWASWCGPCTSYMPYMKRMYDKYKPKGLEIIGISLDRNRNDMMQYLKTARISWIITYTGKGWDDPTVKKYGIEGIPSVWVVGKDGNVITDNARHDLDGVLEKALR